MKKLLLTILAASLSLPLAAFAHEEDDVIDSNDIVAVRSYKLGDRGTAYAIIRKDGHAAGYEFQIEVRPYCRPGQADWKRLEVEDVETACKVNANSLKYDERKQEISIDVWEADTDRYNEDSIRNPENVVMHCMREKTTLKISLKDYCPARSRGRGR